MRVAAAAHVSTASSTLTSTPETSLPFPGGKGPLLLPPLGENIPDNAKYLFCVLLVLLPDLPSAVHAGVSFAVLSALMMEGAFRGVVLWEHGQPVSACRVYDSLRHGPMKLEP